jgi:hypothetical protein
MRNWLLGGAAALLLATGGFAVADHARSQPAPPPGPGHEAPPPHGGPDAHEGPMGWMQHMGAGGPGAPGGPHEHAEMMRRMRQFALVYPAPDRNLSAADVQKIAEAFLLWNGNHTWKVTNVQDQGDRIAFTLATQDGGAIAGFTMNRHTGRLERTN